MGIDDQYTAWQETQACKDLSNWADVVVQQLEDVGSVALGDLEAFRKALKNFDNVMGLALTPNQ